MSDESNRRGIPKTYFGPSPNSPIALAVLAVADARRKRKEKKEAKKQAKQERRETKRQTRLSDTQKRQAALQDRAEKLNPQRAPEAPRSASAAPSRISGHYSAPTRAMQEEFDRANRERYAKGGSVRGCRPCQKSGKGFSGTY